MSQQQHCFSVISALLPTNSLLLTIQLYHAHCIPLVVTTSIAMKSMQRRFGAFGKRSDDQADVGVVLADFKAADDMIERVCVPAKSTFKHDTNKYSSSKTSNLGKKAGRTS